MYRPIAFSIVAHLLEFDGDGKVIGEATSAEAKLYGDSLHQVASDFDDQLWEGIKEHRLASEAKS